MEFENYKKILKRINIIIFIVFVMGMAVFYLFVKDYGKNDRENNECKKNTEILKNVVALIDYRITSNKMDGYKEKLQKTIDDASESEEKYLKDERTNLENVNILTGDKEVALVDARINGTDIYNSVRKFEEIVLRYKCSDDKYRFVKVLFYDEDLILQGYEKMKISGEEGDCIFDYPFLDFIEVFDEDDEKFGQKFELDVNKIKNEFEGYKKVSDCYYTNDTYYITVNDLKTTRENNKFLEYEKNRFEEICKYLDKEAKRTEKYEKSYGTRIKRKLFHSKCMSNEVEKEFEIARYDENGIGRKFEVKRIVTSGKNESSEDQVIAYLFIQLYIFALFWGFASLFVPRLFGYKDGKLFSRGAIFGLVPFLIATFADEEIHAWLSWAFWLGALPMIEGMLLGIKKKKIEKEKMQSNFKFF